MLEPFESGRPDPRYGSAWLCTAMQTRMPEGWERANERTAMHANRASVTQTVTHGGPRQ